MQRPVGPSTTARLWQHGRVSRPAVVLAILVVASAAPACRQAVQELAGGPAGKDGPRALAEALQCLRDDATLRARLGTAARRMMEGYSWDGYGARLVAHGLMPLAGLKPNVALQFHLVAGVLADAALNAAELQAALEATLDSMSPRTRRPIRFLEVGSGGVPLQPAPEDDTGMGSLTA